MEPGLAEVARTLASGLLPGVGYVHRHPDPLRVRHATDRDGAPLLLAPAGGELDAALQSPRGETGVAMVLRVDDVAPVAWAPWRGRLWLAGWVRRLEGAATRAAADEYAELTPTGDLLNVGRGHALYRMEVVDARLARAGRLLEVDLADFRRARPDPSCRHERDLLAHLAAHHAGELTDLVTWLTGRPARAGWRAVRLDRYGLILARPRTWRRPQRIRVPFPRPAGDVTDLARILHPMLCTGRSAGTAPADRSGPEAAAAGRCGILMKG